MAWFTGSCGYLFLRLPFGCPIQDSPKDRFEEAAAFGLGGGELRFQPFAQGQQFFDFGDDAVLFGEWWEGDWQYLPLALADDWQSP